MKNINENYNNLSEKEYYEKLNNYINDGFVIVGSEFPYVKLVKNGEIIELNLNTSKPTLHETMMPNYNDSLLSIIDGFKSNYNSNSISSIDKNIFDKHYKNTLILILDGLGKNILDEFTVRYPNNFLSKNVYKYACAIYPSTTACATTSIKSGLVPFETSWTGWSNYFREVDKEVVLFTGADYYTDELSGIKANDVIPYKPYYDKLDVKGDFVEPDFTNKEYKFSDTLYRALDKLNHGVQTLYIYDTEPDGLLHKLGTKNDQIYSLLNSYSKQIESFYNKLPKDTLLIISADHGHIDNINIKFYLDKYLYSLLKRRPTNDSRCLTFKVKDEFKSTFEKYFKSLYSNIYDLYTKDEFIRLGFVGHSLNKGERLDDFLADFIAVAKTNYTLCLKEKALNHVSNHAGITEEEMVIPLIVLKK